MEHLDEEMIFITHTKTEPSCHQAVRDGVAQYGSFQRVFETTAGCTVTCHCGPGTIGVLFIRK